jgi:hypothetical protein
MQAEGTPSATGKAQACASPPTHRGSLLAILALPFIPYSAWKLWALPSDNDATSAGTWVFMIALICGFVDRTVQSDELLRTNRANAKLGPSSADRPFQFSLGDLLGGVFVIGVLMGIWGTCQEREIPGKEWRAMFTSTWDLLYGSLLTVSGVLLVSGWRRRDFLGLSFAIPVLLGAAVHFIWRGAADDAVFLVWSCYALPLGLVLHVRWKRWLATLSWRRHTVEDPA